MEMAYSIHGVPVWLDYDHEVDVLYIHFEENPSSNHNNMTDDDIILDYHDEHLVGLTVLDTSLTA